MQDIFQMLKSENSINELAENLVSVPGDEIVNLLDELDINLPRSIRFSALQQVLFPVLEHEYNELLKADSKGEGPERLEESRRKTRLRWIDSFSETQFENELFGFNDREIDRKYLFNFWQGLIKYLIKEGVPRQTLATHFEKFYRKYHNNQGLPPVRLFNKTLDPYLYDEDGTFDGLFRSLFAKRVVLSATISEIKKIGNKYGIKVPTRLTKAQVLDIIIEELRKRGEYIRDVHEELNDFNLKEVEEFARLNHIIAFAYINKDQMVEILFHEYDEIAPKRKSFRKDEEIAVQLEEAIEAFEEPAGDTKENIAAEEKTNVLIQPEQSRDIEDFEPIVEEKKELPKPEKIEDEVMADLTEPETVKVEEKTTETKPKEKDVVITDADYRHAEDLRHEIIALKEIVLDLQRDVKSLKEESNSHLTKLNRISKGLVPRWFKVLFVIFLILTLFFIVFIPVSYYYPNTIIIKQIADLFSKIPFFGPKNFLEFLHAVLEKYFIL